MLFISGIVIIGAIIIFHLFGLQTYTYDSAYPELVNGVSHFEQTSELCLTTETFYPSDYGTICIRGDVFPADLYTDGKYYKTQNKPYSFLNCRCIIKDDKSVLTEIWFK